MGHIFRPDNLKLAGFARQAKNGRIWFSLDPDATASTLGAPRERIVRALDWLSEQGMMELQAGGVRHRYRRLASPESLDRLATSLHQRMVKREAGKPGRLRQVHELAMMEGCRHIKLADHFGEQLKSPCGLCSGCRSEPLTLPAASDRAIPGELADDLAPVLDDACDLFDSPRTLSRFLCGITSPKLSRARLGGHRLFGAPWPRYPSRKSWHGPKSASPTHQRIAPEQPNNKHRNQISQKSLSSPSIERVTGFSCYSWKILTRHLKVGIPW